MSSPFQYCTGNSDTTKVNFFLTSCGGEVVNLKQQRNTGSAEVIYAYICTNKSKGR